MADTALNPRMTVGRIIARPVQFYLGLTGAAKRKRVDQLLEQIELEPSEYYNRLPSELSGGQKQRIGIARALAVNPDCLVCDESVAALDVSIQAQVLNLFMDLREDLNLTYLFISHDLGLVTSFCDRVLVMYAGRVVETLDATKLADAQHPYTRGLINCLPKIEGSAHPLPTPQRDQAWAL